MPDERIMKRIADALKRLLTRPAHQNFDHFALVCSRAAVVVHGIDFRRRDFAHLDQRGLVDRLAAQYFVGRLALTMVAATEFSPRRISRQVP